MLLALEDTIALLRNIDENFDYLLSLLSSAEQRELQAAWPAVVAGWPVASAGWDKLPSTQRAKAMTEFTKTLFELVGRYPALRHELFFFEEESAEETGQNPAEQSRRGNAQQVQRWDDDAQDAVIILVNDTVWPGEVLPRLAQRFAQRSR